MCGKFILIDIKTGLSKYFFCRGYTDDYILKIN